MRILAIDTALTACAACVRDLASDELLASESLDMARGHAEALMPLIARVMNAAGLDFKDLDRIAVTVGPGSFTGLRVGISAARGIALAAGREAVGVSTLAAFAAPCIAEYLADQVLVAIDARNGNAYVQAFGGAGRTLFPGTHMRLADAVGILAGGDHPTGEVHLAGSCAAELARLWPPEAPAAAASAHRTGPRHRMGGAARRRRQCGPCAGQATVSAPAGRQAAGRHAVARMNGGPLGWSADWLTGWFASPRPALGELRRADADADAAPLAALHARCFRRGWGADEMEQLLRDTRVLTHRVTVGRALAGFMMSRAAAGEAEILSVAVDPARRGRGLARDLLEDASAPARRPWRAHGVSGGRRRQCGRLPALRARRICAGWTAGRILPAGRPGGRRRPGDAPGFVTRERARSHSIGRPNGLQSPDATDWRDRTEAQWGAAKQNGIEAQCAAQGMRMTEQRRVIARVLSGSDDHPDVEELYRRCAAVDDRISISTVYRTVRLFEDAGIIARHDFREGRARYEHSREDHHDHLIDLRTGAVIEFKSEEIERLQAEVARKLGFRLVDHRLELYAVPLADKAKD